MSRSTQMFRAVVALALAAGCSGGDDDSDESVTTTPVTEATTLFASTTTEPEPTTVRLYSFDGSVPPPPLVNTGTDYEAIYRSIDAYQHWLYGHNPDPELIDEIVVPATSIYDAYESDVADLIEHDARNYDTASVITRVEATVVERNAVTLLVDYEDDRSVVVARAGEVLDDARLRSPSRVIILLTSDASGRWRIRSVDDAGPTEVEL
ncbi:MAG: hypothetical protein ACT4OX_00360 [Actinomycetota bacterium]